ncbi:MAG: tRNA (adenosine(37)-N6)-threonylcarbamoyltransferase complex dimerization subunit type 1 TsaB [Chloroflexi bacterium]|nr:tRNA (adenosine(37)-N6)-threonylcarbamoyltransferase complex dimerization subunit type 1 TsaB [Chloroflexota bacterium]
MHLTIDTSTSIAGVALVTADGFILAENAWLAGRNHNAQIYPAVEHILSQAHVTRGDLTGVIVAIGPGSFTGIRIGMAAAKGLALGLRLPVVGIGTLEAAAYAHHDRDGVTVWAIVDSGRGQVSAAAFVNGAKGWHRTRAEAIVNPAELCNLIRESALHQPAILTGEIPTAVEELVRETLASRVHIPPPFARTRRPASLALLGWKRLSNGDGDDAMALAPLYLRPPAALEAKR